MYHLYSLLFLVIFLIRTEPTLAQQPNFVFILTDDQSYGYMGCTGNPIVQTPNLDLLAHQGVLFTNAYVTSAICTPSRISILLSQYERKHGVNFNSGTSVAPEAWEKSYPMVMRQSGYYTGWIGKNHAPIGENGYESGLMEKSFDYWYAGHGHLSFYPKDRHSIFKNATASTQVEVLEEGVLDFLDNNERKMKSAIRFLEERPQDKPFLLSICLNLPHGAGTGSMKMKESDDDIYKSLYRDKEIPLPQNYVAQVDIKSPKLPAELHKVENRQKGYDYVDTEAGVKERYIRQLQAMTGIDRMVGHLREKLNKLGIDDNTVIIFSSDHGLFMGENGLGGKALCYEKVTHVPLIIYNPLLGKPKRPIIDALVQTIDIAPTILSIAAVNIPETFQGIDLSGLLKGEKKAVRNFIFTENLWSTQFGNPRCEAIQDHHWKYIRYYKNNNLPALKKIETARQLGLNVNKMLYSVHDTDIASYRNFVESPIQGEKAVYEELYNLKIDPQEQQNLVNNEKYKEQLTRLQAAWKKAIVKARGDEQPKVLRYTYESKLEASIEQK